jgi:two-component system, response regulator PdtaR
MVIQTPKPYDLLIADDNRRFRETLREFLEPRLVLRIHEVESGEAAVEYSQDYQMHMHLMTGLEALRVLKDLNAGRPCILITSEATDELRKDAADADAFSVLCKPVTRAELCMTIADALVAAYDDPSIPDAF